MTAKTAPHLGTDPIPRLLWAFALPAVIGLIINASYNLVDRIFVGNGIGALGLAGITVCFPTVILQMALGLMVGVGGSVNFAVCLGQKKVPRAERILANSLLLVFIFTLALVLAHVFFLEDLLRLYGATPTIMPYAKTYLKITLCGSFFLTMNMTLNNFIRASGYPQIAMFTMLIGALTNTILDPVFIFIFHWGIAGAAAATVIAQAASFIWAASFFISKRAPYRVHRKYLSLSLKVSLMICSVGTAPFLIQITSGLMQTVLNKVLVEYGGDLAISAMGVTMAVTILMFMPVIGLCEGSQPVIGFNLGAQNYKRVTKIYRLLIVLSTLLFIISWALLQTFSGQITAVFDPNDEELIQIGSMSMRIIAMLYPLVGLPIATTFFLQATKCPRMASILALSRQLIFLIPGLIILPRYLGLEGVFYAFPVSDTMSCLIAVPVMLHQFKKYKRLEKEKRRRELLILQEQPQTREHLREQAFLQSGVQPLFPSPEPSPEP